MFGSPQGISFDNKKDRYFVPLPEVSLSDKKSSVEVLSPPMNFQFYLDHLHICINLPFLSISPLDAPILVTISSTHNDIFNLPFLVRAKCPIKSLTLYLPSMILQTVAWLLLT